MRVLAWMTGWSGPGFFPSLPFKCSFSKGFPSIGGLLQD